MMQNNNYLKWNLQERIKILEIYKEALKQIMKLIAILKEQRLQPLPLIMKITTKKSLSKIVI